MANLRVKLGKAIRRLRAPLSQEAFADKARLHRTYIGSVERGEVNVSLDNIEKIAKTLGLSPSTLFAEADRER